MDSRSLGMKYDEIRGGSDMHKSAMLEDWDKKLVFNSYQSYQKLQFTTFQTQRTEAFAPKERHANASKIPEHSLATRPREI